MSVLEPAAGLVLAFWILLFLDRSRRWPGELRLDLLSAEVGAGSGSEDQGKVSVIVPARNEEAVIAETVSALCSQTRQAAEILIVDDSSTDGTAVVAEEQGRGTDPLRVISATPTPQGWTGKLHALQCGVEEAGDPEWLVFVDADIRLRPGAIHDLLTLARGQGRDLVSVMARLHARSFWEGLLIPPFVFFFHLLYPFRRVSREDSAVAAAAGGCLLVRRQALDRAGGLKAIRGRIIDDVSLAAAIKGSGGRIWLGLDPGIVSIRPYQGLGGIWRMVARTAFTQLGFRWSLVALACFRLVIFFVSPAVTVVSAVASLIAFGPPADPAILRLLAWGALAWALQAWLLLPSVRHHRRPWIYAAGLPFASVLYGLMTLDSAFGHLRGRGAAWKGRTYRSR